MADESRNTTRRALLGGITTASLAAAALTQPVFAATPDPVVAQYARLRWMLDNHPCDRRGEAVERAWNERIAAYDEALATLPATTTAGLIAKLEHAIEINGGFSDRVETVLRGVIAQLRDGRLSLNGGMA